MLYRWSRIHHFTQYYIIAMHVLPLLLFDKLHPGLFENKQFINVYLRRHRLNMVTLLLMPLCSVRYTLTISYLYTVLYICG